MSRATVAVEFNFVDINNLDQCNCFESLTQINLQPDKDTKQPIFQQMGSRRLVLTRFCCCCFFFTMHMFFSYCKTIPLVTLRPTSFFLVHPSQNHLCTIGNGYPSQNKHTSFCRSRLTPPLFISILPQVIMGYHVLCLVTHTSIEYCIL